jgi:preprotein translocase subunit YajC
VPSGAPGRARPVGRRAVEVSVSNIGFLAAALAPSPQGGAQPPAWVQFMPFVLLGLIFYFLLFAPARRKQKQLNEMLSSLKNGDKVVTSGGIHGKVVGVTEQIIQLRIADGVKIDVSKSAISGKLPE